MKNIFGLIAILVFAMGCDDGDMTFKTFNFGNTPVDSCANNTNSNTIYLRIKGSEVLILDLDPSVLVNKSTFDPVTQTHKLIDVFIDGSKNKIKYINYKNTVTKAMLCGGVLGSLPDVLDEWVGSGNISIRTDVKLNALKITGYSHQITLTNISFKNGEETITVNNNLFGSILSDLGFKFDFINTGDETPTIISCPDNKALIYTSKNNEALILSLPTDAFPTVVGTKTLPLGSTNKALVFFKVFENTVTKDYVCNSLITPIVKQNWRAIDGEIVINTVSGSSNTLLHEIYLKDVILENAKGENLNISDIATITSKGYLFGIY